MADFFYQWQNPVLRKTIYPFREKKLRDFLLFYREIDFWKMRSASAVEPAVAAELLQEITRKETELGLAKVKKTETDQALKTLANQHRSLLSSPEVRRLAQAKMNAQLKLSSQEAKKRSLESRVDWYRRFAPDHPFFEKFSQDLQAALVPYQAAAAELETVTRQYQQVVAPFENEAARLKQLTADLAVKIRLAGEELKKFPPLGQNRTVTPAAGVRWLVMKYEQELLALDHDQLLARVLERFDAEPGRFPKWLQYMVIHFSGMRYQSAHGSWADPRVLLEMIRVEEAKNSVGKLNLEQASAQAIAALQQAKAAEPAKAAAINAQISALSNPAVRPIALGKYLATQAVEFVRKLNDADVLQAIKAMKDLFPGWVWKEIMRVTNLRLETSDKSWEQLTPAERAESWKRENLQWRELINLWEQRDITGWRKEHERTLALVVSRAVCNEVAEHIAHLRGIKPAGELAAKPVWYLNQQKANPTASYIKNPQTAADFKLGASILWLGWVPRQPNAWQIASPVAGLTILPLQAQPKGVEKRNRTLASADGWRYLQASSGGYIRTTTLLTPQAPAQPGGKTKMVPQPVQEWLRWTHEAVVVEVARFADGRDYVLTFETGQIGLNLRPLGQLVGRWDVYVGYVPDGTPDPAKVNEMLDRSHIILPRPAPVTSLEVGGTLAGAVQEPNEEDVERLLDWRQATQERLELWQSLTHASGR